MPTDRFDLAGTIEDAGIPRDKAERIASAIIDAVHGTVATKTETGALMGQLTAVRTDLKRDIAELFAIFWWLLTLPIAAFIAWTLWQWWSYYQDVTAAHAVGAVNDLNFKAYLHFYRHQAFNGVVLALLPLPALVAIRWLATGRWRFGPRW